jgi:hypothetical protein
VKVIARMPALGGPRTFVAQGLTEESASLIFDLVTRQGGAVVVSRDGPRIELGQLFKRAAKAKPAWPAPLRVAASNP